MGDLLSQPSFGMSQYYDRGSLFHTLDPRTRLFAVVLWLVVITVTASVWGLSCALLTVFILLNVSDTPISIVLQRMTRPAVFIMILAVVQILFSPAKTDDPALFQWGPVLVNAAGMLSGIKLLLRFSSLYLLLNWMTVVLLPSDIILALAQFLRPLDRLRIPTHDVVLLVQVALHFLPLLSAEVDRIAKAQASRGAEWGVNRGRIIQRAKQTLPILLPLFITSLHRAENLAQAIEARGYGAGPRTSMVALNYTRWDILAYSAAGIVSLLITLL